MESPLERPPGEDFPWCASCFHGKWLPFRAVVTSRETPAETSPHSLLHLPSPEADGERAGRCQLLLPDHIETVCPLIPDRL